MNPCFHLSESRQWLPIILGEDQILNAAYRALYNLVSCLFSLIPHQSHLCPSNPDLYVPAISTFLEALLMGCIAAFQQRAFIRSMHSSQSPPSFLTFWPFISFYPSGLSSIIFYKRNASLSSLIGSNLPFICSHSTMYVSFTILQEE